MKNKKFLTGLFVLLMILCLGIGYAVVTKDFNIFGTVTTQGADVDPSNPGTNADELLDQNFLVKFDTTKDSDYVFSNTNNGSKVFDAAKTTCTVEYDTDNDRKATIDVKGLAELGDTVVVTFTVVNESPDLNAKLLEAEVTDESGENVFANDYFDVVVDIDTNEILEAAKTDTEGNVILDTVTFTVTISVKKSAIETQKVSFNIDFQAEALLP